MTDDRKLIEKEGIQRGKIYNLNGKQYVFENCITGCGYYYVTKVIDGKYAGQLTKRATLKTCYLKALADSQND